MMLLVIRDKNSFGVSMVRSQKSNLTGQPKNILFKLMPKFARPVAHALRFKAERIEWQFSGAEVLLFCRDNEKKC